MNKHLTKINGMPVTICDDGSVVRHYNSRAMRQLTTKGGISRGYRQVRIGNKLFKVHRLIAAAFLSDYSDDMQVDHIDGDGTNNDITNLRMATSLQNNQAFRRKSKGKTSTYRGVSWDRARSKWKARVKTRGAEYSAGRFDSERCAAVARDALAIKLGFKEEALNFKAMPDAEISAKNLKTRLDTNNQLTKI